MKKLLVFSMLLVSFVSYGQNEKTYFINKKTNDEYEDKKIFNAIVTLNDNTIDFKEVGRNKSYLIVKKQNMNDKITLCFVVDKGEESEFLFNEENKVIEHTKIYTRIDNRKQPITSYYYYSNNINFNPYVRKEKQPQTDYTFSIGTLGGIGNSFNGDFGSGLAYSYGAYIEIGRVGFEGIFGAGLTNNDPSSYINGNSSKYVAGYSMSGVGAYYKFPTQSNMGEYYFGLGYQGLDEIATNNPLWVKAPYGIVGLKGYYFNNCELKIEGNIGVITTINLGFGVRF